MKAITPVNVLALASGNVGLLRPVGELLSHEGRTRVHVLCGSDHDSINYSRWSASLSLLAKEPRSEAQTLADVLATVHKVKAEVILPVAIDDVVFAARHRQALSAVAKLALVPDARLLEQLVNKLHFTRLVESLGLPVPPTLEVTPGLRVADVVSRLNFPMLCKPVIGEGGVGVCDIANLGDLARFLATPGVAGRMLLQEKVPGEDVAVTLLASEGEAFAFIMRKRWFTRRHTTEFSPSCDLEFFQDAWLESLGQRFVKATRFSGIADFDLRVDFSRQCAYFLELDPRFMGSTVAIGLFGVNVPQLLVDQALGNLPPNSCQRSCPGHFLSLGSLVEWLISGTWRLPLRGPVRTNLRSRMLDVGSSLVRWLDPRKNNEAASLKAR